MTASNSRIQARVVEIGRQLLERCQHLDEQQSAPERWLQQFMARIMSDADFRVQALRFIDVLPALEHDRDLARHLGEYFAQGDFPLPDAAAWGIKHADNAPAAHLIAPIVRHAVKYIGRRFIAGADANEAFYVIKQLHAQGMQASLDLLGEAVLSESEAEDYQRQYLELIAALAPHMQALDMPLHLSIKATSLYSQIRPQDEEKVAVRIKERLRPIMRALIGIGGALCLDMEHFDTKPVIMRVFREILCEPEFRDWPHAGIALQTYLRETEEDLVELMTWTGQRGTPVWVRLVRGAYWDMETVIARRENWPCPVWEYKWQTDTSFERCLHMLVENHERLHPAIASHNVRSLALAMVLIESRKLPPETYEFQMLYGMADQMKAALKDMGQPLRVYVPAGPMIPGMAYLVRRLLENTTQASFLRLAFAESRPAAELLRSPREEEAAETNVNTAQAEGMAAFANEPVHRFTQQTERDTFAHAIETVRSRLGLACPLLIGGEEVETDAHIVSTNPARPEEIVGIAARAENQHAEAAVDAATAAFANWRDQPASDRAAILTRAAEMLRQRRDEFAAWEVFEAGKTWREADADVCEAIDYLGYYPGQAVRMAVTQHFDTAGETNAYHYQPRGVASIIPPWNFPLAITAGMCSAALAMGNTVILKPSSQTPVVAYHFIQLLAQAGVPPGVANYLAGGGEDVGEYLVRHPHIHLIAFTGSRDVGCRIQKLAAEVADGQHHIKRVIAEMGGKNAIIVDEDADLDDAVTGVVGSAFGYAGQKCSACSRVITVGHIHEAFVERLVQATASLTVGAPEDPHTFMGPVISAEARTRIRAMIKTGKKAARLAFEMDTDHLRQGHFIGPVIFTDADPDGQLAQDEIFGPVLVALHATDFGQALDIANSTQYALTGGVFSRSPAHLDRASHAFNAGNLYFNRSITGAVVGRQPFGGFAMSGAGHKAGGPDYLLQFVEAKTVTENTLRRGFAPDGKGPA